MSVNFGCRLFRTSGRERQLLACKCESRNYLLPHLRRQRYCRHRTRPGAGQPRARRPFHLLCQSHPARPGYSADLLSRGRGDELSAVPIPAIFAGACIADGGSRRGLFARPAPRALCDPTFDFGTAGAVHTGAQGRRLPFITTLHGTDITLVGSDRSYCRSRSFRSRNPMA